MTAEQQPANSSGGTSRGFSRSLPDAVLIASLTAGGYWLAFLYQVAYLSVFALPPDLVEVSLQTTLLVTLVLSGAWALFWPINLVSIFWPENPVTQRRTILLVIIPVLFMWWLYNFGFRTKDWYLYVLFLVLAAYVTVVEFRFPSRLEQAVRPLRSNGPTVMERILVAFGPAAYALMAFIIIASILVYIAGLAKAETQKAYFLFSDYPEIAVIRIYSDRILALPFDRKSKTVRPEVIIRKIDQKDIRLTLDKDVGPLTTSK